MRCVVSLCYAQGKKMIFVQLSSQKKISNFRALSYRNICIFTFQDAWLIGVVGSAAFEDNAGLTSGGKRVEA